MVVRLKALRQFANRCPVAAWIAFDLEQQQILQGRYALFVYDFLAESQEFPYLVAKICQHFEIMFIQGQSFKLGHGNIHFIL